MAEILADYHAQYPLRPGMAREELKSRVQGREKWSPKLFNELVARGAAEGALAEVGETLCRPGFRIAFTPAQQAKVDAVLAAFRKQPYAPPSMAESLAQTDAEILSALMHQGDAGPAERRRVAAGGNLRRDGGQDRGVHPSATAA